MSNHNVSKSLRGCGVALRIVAWIMILAQFGLAAIVFNAASATDSVWSRSVAITALISILWTGVMMFTASHVMVFFAYVADAIEDREK